MDCTLSSAPLVSTSAHGSYTDVDRKIHDSSLLSYDALCKSFSLCSFAGYPSHRRKGHAKPGSSLQEAPNPRGSINDSPDVERHFDELDPLPWLTQVWTTLAPGTH